MRTMGAYELLRMILGPIVRPVARGIAGLKDERVRAQFASVGSGVVFSGKPTVIGGDRIEIGDECRIMADAYFWATPHGRIQLGARTYIGEHVHLVSGASIEIGADVLIAPFCYIQDADHGFSALDRPIREQPSQSSPIVIEDDVWLGAHTVVTRGVRIGRGAVIGANSVVTHDIAPNTVAAGSPARPIRSRAEDPR
jgi:acetyltransferase-like isoleucine patch superfamily enzyme